MSYYDGETGHEPERETTFERVLRFLGVVSSLLIVGALAYWSFNMGKRDASEVPVITAMEGAVRTAPADPGGENVDFQGLQVNEVTEGNTPELEGDVALAPSADDLDGVEPADLGEAGEEEAVAEEDIVLVENAGLSVTIPNNRPELLYVPPKGRLNPATAEAQQADRVEEDSEEAPSALVLLEEEIRSSETGTLPKIDTPGDGGGEAQAAPALSEPDLGPRLSSGTPLIQLAANEKLSTTQAQWKEMQAANKDILGDKELYVEITEVGGKTYYRLRVQGFASGDDTRAACASLLARNVQCLSVVAK